MKKYDKEFFAEMICKAQASPRKRSHCTIHETPEDPIQRLFVALDAGTYFRPHAHPGKRELITIIIGRLGILIFDDNGRVLDRCELSKDGLSVLELPPGNWHACFAIEPGTVFLEVKPGPFVPTLPEDFAQWAPPENSGGAADCEKWYRSARVGDCPPEF